MKKIISVIAAVVCSLVMSFSSLAGEWKQESDGRWKYQDDAGSYITSFTTDWFIDPATGWSYHFDSHGYMQTGLIEINGKNYFCDTNGAQIFNCITPEGYIIDMSGLVTNNLPGATMVFAWMPSNYGVSIAIRNMSDEEFSVENYCTITTNNMSRTLYMVDMDTWSFVDKGIVYSGIQNPSNAIGFTFIPNDYGIISANELSTVEFYFKYKGKPYYAWSTQGNPLIFYLQ